MRKMRCEREHGTIGTKVMTYAGDRRSGDEESMDSVSSLGERDGDAGCGTRDLGLEDGTREWETQ